MIYFTIVTVIKKLWQLFPDIIFELVPFEDTQENPKGIIDKLGDSIDIVAGIYDSRFLDIFKCSALKVKDVPMCCAVSVFNPLCEKTLLEVPDLYGENLMMLKRDASKSFDDLRDELLKNHPQINIVDCDYYDFDLFNKCENNKNILVTVEMWSKLHPLIKTLHVNWNFGFYYGIVYSENPSPLVKKFINVMKRILQ